MYVFEAIRLRHSWGVAPLGCRQPNKTHFVQTTKLTCLSSGDIPNRKVSALGLQPTPATKAKASKSIRLKMPYLRFHIKFERDFILYFVITNEITKKRKRNFKR